MEMLVDIASLIITVVQIILQQAIVLQTAKVRHSVKKLFISVASMMVAYHLTIMLIHNYSHLGIVVWTLLCILSYTFIFRQTFLNGYLMSISQLVLSTCMEYVGQLAMTFSRIEIQEYSLSVQISMRLLNIMVMLALYLAIKKKLIKIAIPDSMTVNKGLWVAYTVYLLLATTPTLFYIEQTEKVMTNGFEIYNLILFIIFFFYNVMYIRNLNRMHDIEQQLELQQLYSETLEKSINELRGFKHDFANIINSINGFIDIQDWMLLQAYMQKINVEFLKVTSTDIVNTTLKSHPFLYGIVLSKLSLAELYGVAFNISIQCKIDLKYCNPVDFSRMIGIMLDNSLEAAMRCEDKFVNLEITSHHGQYIIEIENSCENNVDLGSIFNKGYTTKPNHSGLGLVQIKSLIEKYRKQGYSMDLQVKSAENIFTYILTL